MMNGFDWFTGLAKEEPDHDPKRPWIPLERLCLRDVLHHHAFAGCGLMGLPDFRCTWELHFHHPCSASAIIRFRPPNPLRHLLLGPLTTKH
jgi:hypothetical protein